MLGALACMWHVHVCTHMSTHVWRACVYVRSMVSMWLCACKHVCVNTWHGHEHACMCGGACAACCTRVSFMVSTCLRVCMCTITFCVHMWACGVGCACVEPCRGSCVCTTHTCVDLVRAARAWTCLQFKGCENVMVSMVTLASLAPARALPCSSPPSPPGSESIPHSLSGGPSPRT